MIKKIISGGQTGADQGGLEAGKVLGLETGGQCPLGWKTEKGKQEKLLSSYELIQNWSSDYSKRTEANVLNSDGTVLFGDAMSPGSQLTARLCLRHNRPILHVHDFSPLTERFFREFLTTYNILVLNVAGNRESKNPGIQERVKNFLISTLKED